MQTTGALARAPVVFLGANIAAIAMVEFEYGRISDQVSDLRSSLKSFDFMKAKF